jgi:aspartate aminotransferase-like enzyme
LHGAAQWLVQLSLDADLRDAGGIPSTRDRAEGAARRSGRQAPFAPAPVEEVVATVRSEKPDVVFAPHVETASGIMLPDDYIRAVADAVHEVGGLMVLDSIASGTVWVDMQATAWIC